MLKSKSVTVSILIRLLVWLLAHTNAGDRYKRQFLIAALLDFDQPAPYHQV